MAATCTISMKLPSTAGSDEDSSIIRTIINATFSFVSFRQQAIEHPYMTNLTATNASLIPNAWRKNWKNFNNH